MTLRVDAKEDIMAVINLSNRNIILHEVQLQWHSFFKRRTLTTVNPTQFLGFGKNIYIYLFIFRKFPIVIITFTQSNQSPISFAVRFAMLKIVEHFNGELVIQKLRLVKIPAGTVWHTGPYYHINL